MEELCNQNRERNEDNSSLFEIFPVKTSLAGYFKVNLATNNESTHMDQPCVINQHVAARHLPMEPNRKILQHLVDEKVIGIECDRKHDQLMERTRKSTTGVEQSCRILQALFVIAWGGFTIHQKGGMHCSCSGGNAEPELQALQQQQQQEQASDEGGRKCSAFRHQNRPNIRGKTAETRAGTAGRRGPHSATSVWIGWMGLACALLGSSCRPVGVTAVTAPQVALSTFANATAGGYKVSGSEEGGWFGSSVSIIGDVNSDGFADFLVGAPNTEVDDHMQAGVLYVLYGGAILGEPSPRTVSDLVAGSLRGFQILGSGPSFSIGSAQSGECDVNGDGIADILVGSPMEDKVYVIFGRPSSDPFADIELSSFITDPYGYIIEGASGSRFGYSVACAGDVNLDGIGDMIVGAPFDSNGAQEAGIAYVLFGTRDEISLNKVVANLNSGSTNDGFRIIGSYHAGQLGVSVGSAGDVNGDSYNDLYVGADQASPESRHWAGAVYVILGQPSGTVFDDLPVGLVSNTRFQIMGAASQDYTGRVVSSAGDVNDDGYADILVANSALGIADRSNAGIVNIIYGHGGAQITVDLLNFTSGASGYRIIGPHGGSHCGADVRPVGDFNRDGFGDIIIGCPGLYADGRSAGAAVVVYGSSTAATEDVLLDMLPPGETTGFAMFGVNEQDHTGSAVGGGGDVNGDGYPDLIVGAFQAGQNATGAMYVLLGKNPYSTVELNALSGDTSPQGFRLSGEAQYDLSASTVCSAGDINDDGYDDLLVGAAFASFDGRIGAGIVYVLYGRAAGLPPNIALENFNPGVSGFRILGSHTDAKVGNALSGAGDVNDDGIDDIIVGSPIASSGSAIEEFVCVIFGRNATTPFSDIDLLTFTSGAFGWKIISGLQVDLLGASVAGAGDVNNDGIDDIIVGLPGGTFQQRTNSGAALVLYGHSVNNRSFEDLVIGGPYGTTGYLIVGEEANDSAGCEVSGVGDINNDGFADVAVSTCSEINDAPRYIYVIFGCPAAERTSRLDLASFSPFTGMLIVSAATVADHIETTVRRAGDFNSDGFDDFLIGSHAVNGLSGAAFVIFGSANPAANITLATFATGADGLRIVGSTGSKLGMSVSAVGDINGDGIDDVLIGAPGVSSYGGADVGGAAYIIFGRGSNHPFTDDILVGSFASGRAGYVLLGDEGLTGTSVASAGDLNGDGFVDIAITAPAADDSHGRVYILLGASTVPTAAPSLAPMVPPTALPTVTVTAAPSCFPSFAPTQVPSLPSPFADIDMSAFPPSALTGYKVHGSATGDRSGNALDRAGDINGDGIDDFIVAAKAADPMGRELAGIVYVIFGREPIGGTFPDIDLNTFGEDDLGFRIFGAEGGDRLGYSVSAAGDVNDDGIDDIIVGAALADTGPMTADAGITYVIFGHNSFTPFEDINLATFTSGEHGFRILGEVGNDQSGYSVSGAGDVNDDGKSDIIIGAPFANPPGLLNCGMAYVIFGQATFEDVNLATFTTGPLGFRIRRAVEGDMLGASVSGAGDFNGDGIDDVLVGASESDFNNLNSSGTVFVIFGQNVNTPFVEMALNGFRIFGATANERLGQAVASAGDVNGDTYDDIIIGGYSGGVSSSGVSYVIFGQSPAFPYDDIQLSEFTSGPFGFRVVGAAANDESGAAVSGAGDVNGDGYDDILIGAQRFDFNGRTDAGAAYVIFGRSSSSAFTDILLASFTSGMFGFRILGAQGGDFLGHAVAAAGDVNNDGVDDLLVSATEITFAGRTFTGITYVVFGTSTQPTARPTAVPTVQPTSEPTANQYPDVALSDIALNASSAAGISIAGGFAGDMLGNSVGRAGDFNGDGIGDFIVAAYKARPNGLFDAGCVYVIFGTATDSPPLANIDLSDANSIPLGFAIEGAAAFSVLGTSVSGAGDVNGDGYDDIIIGAKGYSGAATQSGGVYVLFGHNDSAPFETINVGTISPGPTVGFLAVINEASAGLGQSVRGAGDVNGDGIADIIFGAPDQDMPSLLRTDCGFAYVIFGQPAPFPEDIIDLAGLNAGTRGFRIVGAASSDHAGDAVSDAGDVNGDGVDDIMVGAPGCSSPSRATAGCVFVIFGRPVNATVTDVDLFTFTDLSGPGPQGAGFMIVGAVAGGNVGAAIAGAGDINGDGFDDLLVGSSNRDVQDRNAAGVVYVIFGHSNRTSFDTIDLLTFTADPSVGFMIFGAFAGDWLGAAVSRAGDVNGDGIVDIIVGAPDYELDSDAGAAFIIFGRQSGNPFTNIDLLAFTSGMQGFRILGAESGDQAGFDVREAGDINGDGVGDLIVGAPNADPGGKLSAGRAYVVYGVRGLSAAPSLAPTTTALPTLPAATLLPTAAEEVSMYSDVNLTSLHLDSLGVRWQGAAEFDQAGVSAAGAGDVNGDGFDDIILGTAEADPVGRNLAGMAYVLFGSAGLLPSVDLSTFTSGPLGFRILGEYSGDRAGNPVGGGGDVNGDGFDDVVVTALGSRHFGRANAGSVYVIFGARTFTADVDLQLLSGANGFKIFGASEFYATGYTASNAADVNNDGFSDVIVGARFADVDENRAEAGIVYVLFGHSNATTFLNVDLAGYESGSSGFVIYGAQADDQLSTVAFVGDVNGDSMDDIVISAAMASYEGRVRSGVTYVIFGRSAATPFGTTDMLTSSSGPFGFIIGGANDMDESKCISNGAGDVNGDGFDDILIAVSAAVDLSIPVEPIVGDDFSGPEPSGRVHILFGHAGPYADVDLAVLALTKGFTIIGAAPGDRLGVTATAVRDVNGDGRSDLLLGTDRSAAYVIFSPAADTALANIHLQNFTTGESGFMLLGSANSDYTGRVVSSAGDVNGDGVNDLFITASLASPLDRYHAGEAYVVFGIAQPPSPSAPPVHVPTAIPTIVPTVMPSLSVAPTVVPSEEPTMPLAPNDLRGFSSGSGTGFRVRGAAGGDNAGTSVSGIGDFNGDGIADIAVGAYRVTAHIAADYPGGGIVYVLFGQTDSSTPVTDVELETFTSGLAGFRILSGETDAEKGIIVSGAGDVNGDGLADMVVGTHFAEAAPGRTKAGISFIFFGHNATARAFADVNLTDFASSTDRGFRVLGAAADVESGGSVAAAGDVNNDGYDDVLVGSAFTSPNNAVYLVFGHSPNVPFEDIDMLNVATLADGSMCACLITSPGTNSLFGYSVSGAGDVNGDSYDDIIIGAPFDGGSGTPGTGSANVIYGRAEFNTLTSINIVDDLADLSKGFRIFGLEHTYKGWSVSGAGDVNDDGYADILVGAWDDTCAHLIFGKSTRGEMILSNYQQGTDGFAVCTDNFYGFVIVSAAGDVNGDGFDDFLVGLEDWSYAGRDSSGVVGVIYGHDGTNPFEDIDLASDIGSLGMRILGAHADDGVGRSVSAAGDVNGDGGADIIIGSYGSDGASPDMADAGAAYVLFGSPPPLPPTAAPTVQPSMAPSAAPTVEYLAVELGLESVLEGADGVAVMGAAPFYWTGAAVSGAGDVNGDGIDDFIVSAPDATVGSIEYAGIVYVLYGTSTGFPTGIDLYNFTSGALGFRILGVSSGDRIGYSIKGVGDADGDGLGDILVGTVFSNLDMNGLAFLISSKAEHTEDVDLATYQSNEHIFSVHGWATDTSFGMIVGAAGDFNGDGLADMILGAPLATPSLPDRFQAGIAFVWFGSASLSTIDAADVETHVGFLIFGAQSGDQLGNAVSGAGDVNGDGLDDIIISAMYADRDGLTDNGACYVVFGHRGPFAHIDLAVFAAGLDGFAISGGHPMGSIGFSVSSAGDVNGDGYSDVLIGAPKESPFANRDNGGVAYVIFGHSNATAFVNISLEFFTSGVVGFAVFGGAANDELGCSVSGAGDVNADGFDDIIVGSLASKAYVLFGQPAHRPFSGINLAGFTASHRGFPISGPVPADRAGASVSGIGDVNGDDVDDILVGASDSSPFGRIMAGSAFVIFGYAATVNTALPSSAPSSQPTMYYKNLDLATFTAGPTGFSVLGAGINYRAGFAVSGAGDFNGDGVSDFVVGAYLAGMTGRWQAGCVFVVYGNASSPFRGDIDTAQFNSGSSGFILWGEEMQDQCGSDVSSAGDFNGDGYDDIMLGCNFADPLGRTKAGAVYVHFGQANALLEPVDLRDSFSGFKIIGANPGDEIGLVLASAGDVNNDGFDDIIVGAHLASLPGKTGAGVVFVIFGHNNLTAFDTVDLATFNTTGHGFMVLGGMSGDWTGNAVSGAGDVNGDGIDDIIIGAKFANVGAMGGAGIAYIIFGRNSSTSFGTIDLTDFASGSDGFRILGDRGSAVLGSSVSAGDVNGDGLVDLLIGSSNTRPFNRLGAGAVYVIYGRGVGAVYADVDTAQLTGADGFTIAGAYNLDRLGNAVRCAGDVNGDGVDDILLGVNQADPFNRNDAGASYIIYGCKGGCQDIDLRVAAGGLWHKILGAAPGDVSGTSVSSIGDVNGDGIGDIIIGAYFVDLPGKVDAGAAYVLYGTGAPTAAPTTVPTLAPTVVATAAPTVNAFDVDLYFFVAGDDAGYRLFGADADDNMGFSISSIGDFNGDGYADAAFGSHGANPAGRSNAGAVYVLFGHSTGLPTLADIDLSMLTSAQGFTVIGKAAGDQLGTSVSGAAM